MDLVLAVKPHQVTLVPDSHDALTSSAGWDTQTHFAFLSDIVETLRSQGIRSSIFVDTDITHIELAAKIGADRIELYTEPYAANYTADRQAAIASFVKAATVAKSLGLGVNAGHDLSLENLTFFHEQIPWVEEVSIGHALIADALYLGLKKAILSYKNCLK